MREKILSCIQECVGEEPEKVQSSDILADIVDSITFVKIVVELEEKFNFEFEDEMFTVTKMKTVGDLVDYVFCRVS